MMESSLCVAWVLLAVMQLTVSQSNVGQQPNPANPPRPGDRPARLCGETLALQNRAQMGYGAQPFQPYNSGMQARPHYGRPMMGPQLYAVDIPPRYPTRFRRQAPQQQAPYQPAFVPDMSHFQRTSYPQQASPPQQMNTMQQQAYMPPQRYPVQPGSLQSLLLALDPPDAPDVPDYPLGTPPTMPRNPQGMGGPGPGIPQPGPQLNMPGNPVQQPQPRTPQQPMQMPMHSQQSGPNYPVQQGPPQNNYANVAAMRLMPGVDSVCFCADSYTCTVLEGSMSSSYFYANDCASSLPGSPPQPNSREVCCCIS